MTKKTTILAVAILLVLISCSDDEELKPETEEEDKDTLINEEFDSENAIELPDTLEPLSFFPVYPGSFWKYVVTEKKLIINPSSSLIFSLSGEVEIDEETLSTEPEYQLDSFVASASSTEKIYSTPVYVPVYEGQVVYEYDKIELRVGPPFGFSAYERFPILSEEIGHRFREGYHDNRNTYLGLNYEVLSKELDSSGDSILIIKGTYDITTLDRQNQEVTLIYKKNIGLVKSYIYHTSIGDTIEKRELIDYSINLP